MSLTYQPFADTPEIQQMAEALHVNVGKTERRISGAAAALLAVAACKVGGVAGLLGLATSAGLAYRSLSGHCPAYHQMGVDTNHGASSAEQS